MAVSILHGDVRDVLATLPDDHFDCCVTSPPYWGLRDYGVEGQIGLEPTLTEYLETMVDVCRGVRRVLKPEGTFWLNIGDSYNNRTKVRTSSHQPSLNGFKDDNWAERAARGGVRMSNAAGMSIKEKDLCMVPNRLAIMLQEDGWYVRSEIIWHKPNPMPESVTDRPTSAHEKVWLLTKSERYFYDADAIREPMAESSIARLSQPNIENQTGSPRANGGAKTNGNMKAVGAASRGANARNVWTIATQPFAGAHFATMAPDVAERCIKAGSPAGGLVLDPFGGAGTTGLVADRLGRDCTLIEINPEYAALARARIDEARMGPVERSVSRARRGAARKTSDAPLLEVR